MTPDQVVVFIILGAAVLLFVTEKIRVDLVALLVLAAIILTGLLPVEEALAGFASPAVVTVWAVFIISGAMSRSGIADVIAGTVLRFAGASETRLLLLIMGVASVMSAFMNNIGAVAILMPAVTSIGRKLDIPPARLLMPLAFAALLGGNMTLIGTPPNILASDILADYGGIEPFAFFDFLPMGLVVVVAGALYMMLIGRHLLPKTGRASARLDNAYPVRENLTELRIEPDSQLRGVSVSETELGIRHDLNIVYVVNREEKLIGPMRGYALQNGDLLVVEGLESDVAAAVLANGLSVVESFSPDEWKPELAGDNLHLAEITLRPNSRLAAKTLRTMDFRRRYGLSVLALRHRGAELTDHFSDIPINFGDSLLVQGPVPRLDELANSADLMVLEEAPPEQRRTEKAPLAALILLGVLIVAAIGLLPVAAVMLMGAVLLVLTGVLTMDEAYESIDWRAVFLIAGMLPLGVAMETSGTARLLADQLIGLVGGLGPLATLAAIFILTALLTEVISNAAAAVLVVPISIDVALGLTANPEPFVMATVIAASTSFLTPVGHQVNVLIFGAGDYRFSDYAKVGVGLNLLMLLLAVTVLPLIWPL